MRLNLSGFGIYLLGIAALIAVIAGVMLALSPYNIFPACIAETCLASEDLKAQNSMAAAAWVMVFVSALSLIVGTISVWLIWLTLRATQKSVLHVREAAAVADKSATIADAALRHQLELGQVQTKCYPIVSAVSCHRYRDRFNFTVKIFNSGQTPNFVTTITAEPTAISPTTNDNYTFQSAIDAIPSLPAGGEFEWKFEARGEDGIFFAESNLTVLIEIEVEFSSVFRREEPTNFGFYGKNMVTNSTIHLLAAPF